MAHDGCPIYHTADYLASLRFLPDMTLNNLCMSEFGWVPYRTLGDIAKAFIDNAEDVNVEFGFNIRLQRHCLIVSNSGLLLRDVRCWLPDNITVQYGVSQDYIIFIDSNVE